MTPQPELPENVPPSPPESLLKQLVSHHLWQLVLGLSVLIGTAATVIAYRNDLCQFVGLCSPSLPAMVNVSFRDSEPLDGYHLIGNVELPPGLVSGPVLPAGARTRLVIQAADPSRVVEIDRIDLQVTKLPVTQEFAFNYRFDTVGQSAFGAVQPRQFNVMLRSYGEPKVYYISKTGVPQAVPADNLLPAEFPVLTLDAQSGLQEILDFNIAAANSGIYQVIFAAHLIASHVNVISTTPIYIVKK